MTKPQRSCPICRSEVVHEIASLTYALWDDLAIDGYAELVACQDCGMVYHQTNASEQDFSRYYTQNAYYAAAETLGSGGLGEEECTRFQRIDGLLESCSEERASGILDVGAGKGGFLHWCKAQGYSHLIALEKSTACAETIRQTLALSVCSEVKQLPETGPKIDRIILSHVLEHAFQPLELLTELLTKVDDHALFYIEVPNAQWYANASNPWRYFYFEHINHFDMAHLEALLKRAGLKIISAITGPFLPGQGHVDECCMVVASKGAKASALADKQLLTLMRARLSRFSDVSDKFAGMLTHSNIRFSIWGISQYTQLLLGNSSALRDRLRYLIDKSPAKAGRFLQGHRVEPVEKLAELDRNDVLLIPEALFSPAMQQTLTEVEFAARIVLF